MRSETRRILPRLVIPSLAFVLCACAGTGLRDSCEVGGFRDYADFDAATLRYVVAFEKGSTAEAPFFALEGSDRTGSPMSIALRFELSDESLSREGCPAGSELRTYRVTNSSAAWRVFWLTANDVEASFRAVQRSSDDPQPKGPGMAGMLLFDTETGDAQFACGCLR